MAYIQRQGIKCHWGFKLLPKGFCAITLFGHVFFRMGYVQLNEFLYTNRGYQTLNHERIHILQAKKLGWLRFYALYLGYWLKYIFQGYGNMAYYLIPFEREAYANQDNYKYSQTFWRDYIYG